MSLSSIDSSSPRIPLQQVQPQLLPQQALKPTSRRFLNFKDMQSYGETPSSPPRIIRSTFSAKWIVGTDASPIASTEASFSTAGSSDDSPTFPDSENAMPSIPECILKKLDFSSNNSSSNGKHSSDDVLSRNSPIRRKRSNSDENPEPPSKRRSDIAKAGSTDSNNFEAPSRFRVFEFEGNKYQIVLLAKGDVNDVYGFCQDNDSLKEIVIKNENVKTADLVVKFPRKCILRDVTTLKRKSNIRRDLPEIEQYLKFFEFMSLPENQQILEGLRISLPRVYFSPNDRDSKGAGGKYWIMEKIETSQSDDFEWKSPIQVRWLSNPVEDKSYDELSVESRNLLDVVKGVLNHMWENLSNRNDKLILDFNPKNVMYGKDGKIYYLDILLNRDDEDIVEKKDIGPNINTYATNWAENNMKILEYLAPWHPTLKIIKSLKQPQ